MPTPLYDALRDRAGAGTARFHIPGHKGRAVTPALRNAAELDFTELTGTGNLYTGGDVIEEAEGLWAAAWGFPYCQFLTCGATQGVYAALLLARRRGRGVLVDRACHRSVYHGAALWDLSPAYFPHPQDRPVDPAAVAAALERRPEIKTVCITSPTYYGVLSDVQELSKLCHARGAWLVVDGAHGAHLPFLGPNPFLGADLVVTSPHKTLPVYGQGALLFSAGVPGDDLRWAAGVTGTSSPSYPVMASMDWAREWMQGPGRGAYEAAAEWTAACRRDFSALTGEKLDPTRLTLETAVPGEGFLAQRELEALGVAPEMADRDHVVCVVTGSDSREDWARLRAGLEATGRFRREDRLAHRPRRPVPAPEVAVSPRAALLAPRRQVKLRDGAGLIAGETVAPYPPGSPVIAPGERITKKALAYLEQIGYNVDISIAALDGAAQEGGPL